MRVSQTHPYTIRDVLELNFNQLFILDSPKDIMRGWIYNWLFWTPRVLAILMILFIFTMSLDIYTTGMSFWEVVKGMLVHNIPTFILIALLIVSWKYELLGAIGFLALATTYIVMTKGRYPIVYTPLILVAILFFIDWNVKRK